MQFALTFLIGTSMLSPQGSYCLTRRRVSEALCNRLRDKHRVGPAIAILLRRQAQLIAAVERSSSPCRVPEEDVAVFAAIQSAYTQHNTTMPTHLKKPNSCFKYSTQLSVFPPPVSVRKACLPLRFSHVARAPRAIPLTPS